jgi:hypothetical protein
MQGYLCLSKFYITILPLFTLQFVKKFDGHCCLCKESNLFDRAFGYFTPIIVYLFIFNMSTQEGGERFELVTFASLGVVPAD